MEFLKYEKTIRQKAFSHMLAAQEVSIHMLKHTKTCSVNACFEFKLLELFTGWLFFSVDLFMRMNDPFKEIGQVALSFYDPFV